MQREAFLFARAGLADRPNEAAPGCKANTRSYIGNSTASQRRTVKKSITAYRHRAMLVE